MAKSNAFKTAVAGTPDISNCYQSGLSAMGKYTSQVQLSGSCEGSVDIDKCVREKYPNANRWDYTIGHKSKAYFIEVHSANTSEVTTVLKKLGWLKDWLNNEAPKLNAIKAKECPFIWLASGKYNILKSSPQFRRAIQAGLNPRARLAL